MVHDYVVIRSDLILDSREARRYYEERLAGLHVVSCHGRDVTLFFEHAMNHVYTTEPLAGTIQVNIIRRRIRPGVFDERVLSLDRARLMDRIIPAVCYYSFSLPGTGTDNRENRLVHGQRLPDGRYLRVVLSPGPRDMWFCKSAYPIESREWLRLRGARTVKFPP